MEDPNEFIELSALLTGLHNLVQDAEDHRLAIDMAAEYQRRLHAVLGDDFAQLMAAYRAVRTAGPGWSPALLAQVQATPAFQAKDALAARQIVNIWYFSQFTDTTTNLGSAHFFDGGFYERGHIWPIIKAHPIGFSSQPYGYWTTKPN